MNVRPQLKEACKKAEGTGPVVSGRFMPYVDCCGKYWKLCTCAKKGNLTIGYGHNLDARGLTYKQSEALLDDDLDEAIKDLVIVFPAIDTLDTARQAVLAEMCFNLGVTRLRQFHEMWRAIKAGDFERAAIEMLDSTWAEQVGSRALRLAEQMRTGQWK